MEAEGQTETEPLLGKETVFPITRATHPRSSSEDNEELGIVTQWPEESGDTSIQCITADANGEVFAERPMDFCRKACAVLKFFLFDSHWPLILLIAVSFLGVWLPKKRRSMWPFTFIPVFHLLFGLGAHLYFILTSNHRSVHIGSKMLLTSLWISAFASYVLALYYFRYQSQEWMKDLNKNQRRAVNVALFTGLLLVSLILFGDAYYQVIFDLVNIKEAL